MKIVILLAVGFVFAFFHRPNRPSKVFDVHIHGSKEVSAQLQALKKAGVYKAAISTSWELQNSYRKNQEVDLLYGLMFPCPNGKVPYSGQPCYSGAEDWPSAAWVEQQIREGHIDYFGEVLSQYYGISSSDSLLFPYYALAQKYNLPVGIHTGGAGPGHGSPNFKLELGNPVLLQQILTAFPKLKVWIMHGGDQYYKEAIAMMKMHPQVYADLSVLSNPDIVPGERFSTTLKTFMEVGLEDRIMFGSDNGDIEKVIRSIEALSFLTAAQKEKIYFKNAERFFARQKK